MSNGPEVVAAADRAVTQPANKALGYGQRAVGGVTRVAQAPPKQPARLTHTEKLVHLHGKAMGNVDVKPYSQITWHKELANFGYAAWTNSSTVMYVRDLSQFGLAEAVYYDVLYHEGWHVKQFRQHGGYPDSYEQMTRHEVTAYGKSADWLEKYGDKYAIPRTYKTRAIASFRRKRDGLRKELQIVAQQKLPDDQREATFKEFLLGKGRNMVGVADDGKTTIPEEMLPAHGTLEELYGYPRKP